MRVNGNLVLNDNGSGELRHVYIERLDNTAETAAAATLTSAHKGRLIFNTTSGVYKYWDGSVFQAFASGGSSAGIQAELDALEVSLGAFINANGTFNASALSGLVNVDVSGATTLLDVLEAIDAELGGASALSELTDVTITAPANKQGLFYNSTTSKWENRAAVLADVSDVTATATELNYVDGVTSSIQTQFDDLSTALDGKQDTITGAATTIVSADLAANKVVVSSAGGKVVVGEASTAEVNYLVGVTSSVQEQLDNKQADLGYVPVDKAGDSLSGNLTFGGTSTVKNLAAPSESGDAVRKIDLDNAVAGIAKDYQADVVGLETDFAGVAGRYIYVDGSEFTAGATGATAGDIVVVDAVGAVTAVAYDVSVEGPGALVWNRTAEAWYQWNGTAWSAFGGLSGVNAGVGLEKVGNTINVLLGAGVADLPTGEVGLDLKTDGGLALVDPTAGTASTATNAVLSLKLDGTTLTKSATGVKVGVIDAANISNAALGDGLLGGAGTPLSVDAGSGLTFNAGALVVDETVLDTYYLRLSGGTMTGDLVLAGNADAALEAVPKQQLDAAVADVAADIATIVTSLNKIHHVHAFTNTGATTVITVTHNIGVKYVNVTVVDEDDEVFIPQSIKFVDTNTLEVTLNTDISGNVVVVGHAALTL